jgi:hypothetical protein
MIDCRKCIYFKVNLILGFWDKHYQIWIGTHSIYNCNKDLKVIRTYHRDRCRGYIDEHQIYFEGEIYEKKVMN